MEDPRESDPSHRPRDCGRLQSVAHRILRDYDFAEDATQQALLRIWQNLPKLRDPARFDAWSYQLLVRATTCDCS
jgi:DNA-directed RNA polymerase specialized sigma24 family protein